MGDSDLSINSILFIFLISINIFAYESHIFEGLGFQSAK